MLEGVTAGSQFARIVATDADSGEFGRVTYSIISESEVSLLQADPLVAQLMQSYTGIHYNLVLAIVYKIWMAHNAALSGNCFRLSCMYEKSKNTLYWHRWGYSGSMLTRATSQCTGSWTERQTIPPLTL